MLRGSNERRWGDRDLGFTVLNSFGGRLFKITSICLNIKKALSSSFQRSVIYINRV